MLTLCDEDAHISVRDYDAHISVGLYISAVLLAFFSSFFDGFFPTIISGN